MAGHPDGSLTRSRPTSSSALARASLALCHGPALSLTPQWRTLRYECAGLWDVLSPRAAVKLVRKRNLRSAQAAAAALVKAALSQGSVDNVLVQVVYLGARPPT